MPELFPLKTAVKGALPGLLLFIALPNSPAVGLPCVLKCALAVGFRFYTAASWPTSSGGNSAAAGFYDNPQFSLVTQALTDLFVAVHTEDKLAVNVRMYSDAGERLFATGATEVFVGVAFAGRLASWMRIGCSFGCMWTLV